jgi:hypothetical protein
MAHRDGDHYQRRGGSFVTRVIARIDRLICDHANAFGALLDDPERSDRNLADGRPTGTGRS